jgi:hypothetical protein
VLCAAPNPQQVSKKMCRDLLEANRDSVKVKNQRGLVPLEVVCTVKDLTESSVDICSQIADACSLEESTDVFLNALNVLCKSTQFTEHSVMTCKVILSHIKRKISAVTGEGILPLHALCKAEDQNDSTGNFSSPSPLLTHPLPPPFLFHLPLSPALSICSAVGICVYGHMFK